MSLDFIVASEEEIGELNSLEKLFDLWDRQKLSACGANNFHDFKLLAKFFQHRENYVPNEVIKTVNHVFEGEIPAYNVYRLETEFFETILNFDRAHLDNAESVEFWQSRGYFGMGVWNCVYGVHNLCKIAVRENRNLYLVEEIE